MLSNLRYWQLFGHFVQRFHTITDSFLVDVGVPRGQAAALCTIVGKEGLFQSQIGEVLAIQGATVTNMLQRMEESEFVRRERDTDDNRLVRVYTTELGREKEELIVSRLNELQECIFEGVNEADRAKLRELIERILDNMGRP